jgi:hypothetical protein
MLWIFFGYSNINSAALYICKYLLIPEMLGIRIGFKMDPDADFNKINKYFFQL